MACHAAKLATTNGYTSFRKAHSGEQKIIANKAQNAFCSSNENAVYVIITSKFASIKFQQCCVRKLKTKSLHLKFSNIARGSFANLALGQYKFGFEAQPIAHNDFVWNFLGMVLAGLCFSLSEGCPGKHLVQMGTGNLHSGIFVIGMMAGAGFAHNFLLASSPAGITPYAPWAVGLGFVFAVYVGVLNRAKA